MAGYQSMAELRAKEEAEKAKAKALHEKTGKGDINSYSGGTSSGMDVVNPDEDQWKQMSEHASSSGPVDGAHQVTMYRDGFTINNGPLRPVSDPINKKFVDEIAAGVCPDELKGAGDTDVPVSMTDKRGEDYTEPAAALSGTAPRKAAAPAKIENAISGGEGTVAVDAAKPTTKIQIRFHDGSKKAQEFNQDQTVGDLRTFCAQVTGQAMTVKGGYPPKPLTDDSQTLKDAGLCGAAVTVAPA